MQLRRIVTVYALAFGVPLVLLGGGTTPAVEAPGADTSEQLQKVATPTRTAAPTTVTRAAPGHGSLGHLRLGHYDIPATALLAYQRAADIMATVSPSCELSWTLLAAIGRVESDHGRYAGATLSPDGVSTPHVVGVALDGAGPVAAIRDTDQGRWDGDPKWDRAVGPMQFLPSTWSLVGVDADGDGKRSINDIDDAALAAGVYLCAGAPLGLGSTAAVDEALHRYNDSDYYAALVMAYERLYRGGEFQVLTPPDGVPEATAALLAQPLPGLPTGLASATHAPAKARVGPEVRQAISTTRKQHGTKAQQAATGGTAAAKAVRDGTKGTGGSTSGGADGGTGRTEAGAPPSGTGGTGGEQSGGSTGGNPGDNAGDNAGGGSGSAGDDGGSGGGSTPSTSGPTDSGSGSTGSGSTGSDSGGAAGEEPSSPPSSGSDGQTPTDPPPSPTPTATSTTALLTAQDGVYLLGGKRLDLGPAAQADATAAGDFDGDGSVETNAEELAGLLGRTVTMVVVEREDGSLGVVSINGIPIT